MTDPAFHTPLVREGILVVRGPDAAKFLQGQLTYSLAHLNDETSSPGGRCNIKDHLLSSFYILPEDGGLLLAMAGELLEAQLANLRKYTVFSRASLTDKSAAWLRIGLRGASEALRVLGVDTPAESGRIARYDDLFTVALDDARVELRVPARRAETVLATLHEHSRGAPLDGQLLGQVRAGVDQVFGATRELLIPQTIDLQAVSGVGFKRGCYVDQEIVARMQYLGRLRYRLYRLALDAGEVPASGAGLFSPVHSTSVGEVVLAARTPGSSIELLVVLQDDAVTNGQISLGSAEGAPLILLNPPYTLGSDHEIQC